MSLNLEMARNVWECALPKGCNKLVLQCFIHHLNAKENTAYFGLSWPGVPRVAKMCGMSERSVQCHIRALQAAGILRARVRTGRTTRYSIHIDSLVQLVFEPETVLLDAPDVGSQPVDNSKNPAEIVDNSAPTPATFAQTLPVFAPQPAENDTKPVEICTLTLNRTLTEPLGTAAPALPASALMIDSVKPEVLAAFAAIRKAKRKEPVTAKVIEEICQQAHLAGLTLEQALQHCCHPDRKWARFEASWMQPGGASTSSRSRTATTMPTPAAALWKPPVSAPAAPEIRAAEQQRQRQLLQTRPEPVAGIQLGRPGPGWAHAIVHKHQSGQSVTRTQLREACLALKITPASLSAAHTDRTH